MMCLLYMHDIIVIKYICRTMMVTPPPDSIHPLVVALSSNQPRLGYFYLHYLSKHTNESSLEPYTAFAEIFDDLSLNECIVKDLKVSSNSVDLI